MVESVPLFTTEQYFGITLYNCQIVFYVIEDSCVPKFSYFFAFYLKNSFGKSKNMNRRKMKNQKFREKKRLGKGGDVINENSLNDEKTNGGRMEKGEDNEKKMGNFCCILLFIVLAFCFLYWSQDASYYGDYYED